MASERPGNTEVPPGAAGHDAPLVTYEESAPQATASPSRRWWRLPMLMLGLAVIMAALWSWSGRVNTPTAAELLEQATQAMQQGDLEAMQESLDAFAATWLQDAPIPLQGRYYALAGDWIWLWQRWRGINETQNHRRICQDYEQAELLGEYMDPIRLERWGMASTRVDEMERAREVMTRLADLNAEQYPSALDRRHRVYATWIHRLIELDGNGNPDHLADLAGFRDASRSSQADRAWASARMAEIRLATGEPEDAVRMLHADLRRLEQHSKSTGEAAPIGELLMLLGRGNRDLGEWEIAASVLGRSLDACSESDPVRGEAWVLMGQVLAAQGDIDGAYECHDRALEEVPASPSNLPALVGRGELRSLLGDHEAALADLAEAARLLEAGRIHPDINRHSLKSVFMDRYEAVVLQDRLDLALAYASAAAGLFDDESRPGEVSHAVAVAAGQLAWDLTQEATERAAPSYDSMAGENWEVRSRGARLHVRAADAHRAAARWWHDLPGEEERWRGSLFEAGRHDDAAGRAEGAIEAFTEAIAATPGDDPRRGGIMYRLGRCLQAEGRFDEAVSWYGQVIEEWPSSPDATRCHVPLARCLEALGEVDAAWTILQQVVDGRTVLTPDAVDYGNALLELGALGYRTGRYLDAITHLEAALARSMQEPDRVQAYLVLAGCTRGAARDLTKPPPDGEARSPSLQDVVEAKRRSMLQRSYEAYGAVVDACTSMTPTMNAPGWEDDLRTSLVGQGDAAYDLQRYEEAIGIYEQVARDFDDHPASMHALIQVAGAWVELGDTTRAAAAHERALQRLESMPDDALSRIDSLMDREIWERWMRIMPVSNHVVTVDEG